MLRQASRKLASWRHHHVAQSAHYALELLLERRRWLFLAAYAFFLLQALVSTEFGGGSQAGFYTQVGLVPVLLLELPALCSLVSLERKSGCLDLALSVPSPQAYFLRRLAPVCGLLLFGAWITLLVGLSVGPLARLAALVQIGAVIALLAAVTLFWAVRLETAGGVLVASVLTTAALSKWILFVPFPEPLARIDDFHGVPLPLLAWVWNTTVLGLAMVIFYLYARRRLRRPETLLR